MMDTSVLTLIMEGILFASSIIGVKLVQNALLDKVGESQTEDAEKLPMKIDLIAANYHFTRKCNYKCGFCFHTEKTSYALSLDEAKKVLKLLREAGCKKINFAGGEPFLPEYRYKLLAPLVKYAKEECGFDSVSIITNGSHVEEKWIKENHQYLDILGVSCDSTDESVNVKIGRGKGHHKEQVMKVAQWCHKYNVKFKLNTVVNAYNWEEDMSDFVNELNPMRWKIFQVLALEGENSGAGAKRTVAPFLIDDVKYASFVERNKERLHRPDIMKVEDNSTMQSSYILVDEYGRFLDCSTGGKTATASVLEEGGVSGALAQLATSAGGGFDQPSFIKRDGYFPNEWSKNSSSGGGGCCSSGGAGSDIEDLMK